MDKFLLLGAVVTLNKEELFLFNNTDIRQVDYIGYSDSAEKKFMKGIYFIRSRYSGLIVNEVSYGT